MTLIPRITPVPVIKSRPGHALAQAALFDEVFLQTAELLVSEIVGLVNQADGDVGNDFGRAGFHKFAVKLVGLRHFAPEPADIEGFLGVLVPFVVFADAEIIAVVVEHFLKAGAGDAGEFEFGFLGSLRRFAAFEQILFAGAGGLDHLVNGAVAPGEILVREAEGDVIHHLGFVEGVERLVIAARRDDGMG